MLRFTRFLSFLIGKKHGKTQFYNLTSLKDQTSVIWHCTDGSKNTTICYCTILAATNVRQNNLSPFVSFIIIQIF